MKKHFIVCGLFIIFVFSLLLCACGEEKKAEPESVSQEAVTWGGSSLAEGADSKTPAPEGVEIVTDFSQFASPKADQTYQPETDEPPFFNEGGMLVRGKDCYYICANQFLYVFDPDTKQFAKLCNKPECEHEPGTDCNALVLNEEQYMISAVHGLFYYQGSLYV